MELKSGFEGVGGLFFGGHVTEKEAKTIWLPNWHIVLTGLARAFGRSYGLCGALVVPFLSAAHRWRVSR
jgi:hypothetical protein